MDSSTFDSNGLGKAALSMPFDMQSSAFLVGLAALLLTAIGGYAVIWEDSNIKNKNKPARETADGPTMTISQLWVYPIKSLRGCSPSTADLNKHGFTLDRKFILLKVEKEGDSPKLKHMQISAFASMCLFHPAIHGDQLIVTYRAPGNSLEDPANPNIEISLEPRGLKETVDVNMYGSPCTAFKMGDKYNDWFSDKFGFKVVLAYWGGNSRKVLGNLNPTASHLNSATPNGTSILSRVPILNRLVEPIPEEIAFNDCASFLVITEESVASVSNRLPEGVDLDLTKFRSNIVLKGSPAAFAEDVWGEIILRDNVKILLTGNCVRCVSLNVNYETGQTGTGKDGLVLKSMMGDRRIDAGSKYSPVFGRYGFLDGPSRVETLSVGDRVRVTKKYPKTTTLYWPGMTS